jgi:hypothetical protein
LPRLHRSTARAAPCTSPDQNAEDYDAKKAKQANEARDPRACADGLKGFPEAINSVFPQTQIQTCIVHLIRNSLDFCSWKDRKPVAKELKSVVCTPLSTSADVRGK